MGSENCSTRLQTESTQSQAAVRGPAQHPLLSDSADILSGQKTKTDCFCSMTSPEMTCQGTFLAHCVATVCVTRMGADTQVLSVHRALTACSHCGPGWPLGTTDTVKFLIPMFRPSVPPSVPPLLSCQWAPCLTSDATLGLRTPSLTSVSTHNVGPAVLPSLLGFLSRLRILVSLLLVCPRSFTVH